LPTGQIIEKLDIANDASQSYALYLPTNYSPEKVWPVIYFFDPGARGNVPLLRFRAAAEKYGYVLAGSNNSKNGPGVPLESIFRNLWEDSHRRIQIDDGRVFTAGFSGGARVASRIAIGLKEKVAGVIACSGGLPSQYVPSREMSFLFAATAGTEDFNNPEMVRLDRIFESLQKPHMLATFVGGHDWPPEAICLDVIEWLELESMKQGRLKRSDPFIDELYLRRLAHADKLLSEGDVYNAYLRYSAFAADFAGLKDVSAVESKLPQFRNSKEVRSGIKLDKEIEERQARMTQRFLQIRDSLRDADTKVQGMTDLKFMIADLRRTSNSNTASSERTVSRRLLSLFFVQAFEDANAAVYQKKFADAVASYSLCVQLQPENGRAYYNLARAYSLNRERKRAREALKSAIDKGFNDTAAIERLEKELEGDK
jgi:pimeloyl-ACP methyl ester carboxylesterase